MQPVSALAAAEKYAYSMLMPDAASCSAILPSAPGLLSVSIMSTSVSSASIPASPKKAQRLLRIAHYDSHGGMFAPGFQNSEGVNVDLSFRQRFANLRERARVIDERNRQLRSVPAFERGVLRHRRQLAR